MSSLHDFLGGAPEPAKIDGEEIEMSFMCPCGSSNTRTFTSDHFKTAKAMCNECGAVSKVNIPTWMKEMFG